MKRFHYILMLALLAAASCGGGEEPQPEQPAAPVLVSTSPADGTEGITGTSFAVVFSYDQNVKCPVDAQNKITVDGGASIEKVFAYEKDVTVSVSGLTNGKTYTLTLPEGTVQGYKYNQKAAAAVSFSFSTRKDTPVDPGTDPSGWENSAACAVNMGLGWNLGNTLDSNSGDVDNMWIEAFSKRTPSDYETAWGQPVATRALIHMFKEAGFNSIRVPVTWYPHMGTVSVTVSDNKGHWNMSTWTGYDVDPAWMARVKEVVGYVLDEGMYCILNVHHDTGTATTGWLRADRKVYDSVKERYCALWKQIATEFEPYGQKLVFESFNEMLDAKGTWNSSTAEAHEVINLYNADFVATVRSTGGNNAHRNLILNTYGASCTPEALAAFKLPEDPAENHLLAEVHSYAPYHFAFETDTPKTVFDASCESEVRSIIENINTYLVSRGVPCVLGEFGADTHNRADAELAKQATCYVSAASKYNIPCFYWMTLSDGKDRSVPKWTKPVIKDALLKAYRESRN